MTNKPRPHAAKIIEWANGAKIRFRAPGSGKWTYSDDPAWIADYEYEVVPEAEYPKTKMSHQELADALGPGSLLGPRAWDILNIGLRHAIDAGQVVTREEFDRAIGDRDARDYAVADKVAEEIAKLLPMSHALPLCCINLKDMIAKVKA